MNFLNEADEWHRGRSWLARAPLLAWMGWMFYDWASFVRGRAAAPAKIAFFLLCLAGTAHAQLKWERKEIALRPGPQETNTVAHFKFENAGSIPIAIQSATPSCDCITVDLGKKTFGPGEKGEVSADFKIGERVGEEDKTVLVKSNDPREPSAVLTLKVLIPRLLEIVPAGILWRVGEDKTPKIIDLKVNPKYPIRILKVGSNQATMAAELKEVKSGREYQIKVTPTNTVQPIIATLDIKTDFPAQNPKTFHAYALIRPKE